MSTRLFIPTPSFSRSRGPRKRLRRRARCAIPARCIGAGTGCAGCAPCSVARLRGCAESRLSFELLLEMVEEVEVAPLWSPAGSRPAAGFRAAAQRRGEPLIADDQHTAWARFNDEKAGFRGHWSARYRRAPIVVQEPGALRPDQHAAGFARREPNAHLHGRMARRHLAPSHAAIACRCRVDMDEIGDRRPAPSGRAAPFPARYRRRSPRRPPCRRPAVARPQQRISRAAIHHRPAPLVPIFSPSCGSTRMIAKLPDAFRLRSVPAISGEAHNSLSASGRRGCCACRAGGGIGEASGITPRDHIRPGAERG
mgnify:CR=1 FL=1